jgi:hypothetical protein
MDMNRIREYGSNPEVTDLGQQKLQEIVGRSATDADFRRKLIEEPRTALREALGQELPADVNIRFVENRAAATIVLPDYLDPSAELSDSQLEAVAGGIIPLVVVLGAVAAGMALGTELHKATCDQH